MDGLREAISKAIKNGQRVRFQMRAAHPAPAWWVETTSAEMVLGLDAVSFVEGAQRFTIALESLAFVSVAG